MWHLIRSNRLDAIAFVALSSLAMFLTARLVRRREARVNPYVYGLLAMLLAAGCLLSEFAGRREHDRLRTSIEGLGPTYAAAMTERGHHRITLDTAADDPLYLSLIEAQKQWLQLNPYVSDIYTMRCRADGQIVLVVDSETDYNRNGAYDGDREERTAIGEEYEVKDAAMQKALSGTPVFTDEPITDRWGTWVSAFVPMRDAQGNVEAILGIDFDASDWAFAIARARALGIVMFAIPVAALICSAGLVAAMRAEVRRRARSETALRQSKADLSYQATHDRLTGLMNRAAFHELLAKALREAITVRQAFAVMFLDFDRFKLINDSFGHDVGDLLLQSIAQRLSRIAAQQSVGDAIVARLGGDEFVVLARGPGIREHAPELAEGIVQAMMPPHLLGGHEVHSTASIGITISEFAYQRPEDVLRDADTAMYRAKGTGGARWALFDQTMHHQTLERITLENDLRHALSQNEMHLAFQPVVTLAGGELHGFEALLRWHHSRRGDIAPSVFIPIAEEAGLIHEIGTWVLDRACAQLTQWQKLFPQFPRLTMSVNVSRKQLAGGELVRLVGEALNRHKPAHGTLAMEITESTVMDDTESATRVLSQIRAMGVKVYLDDFGTGYSSLSCLHRIPLDKLKIDRAFVESASERREYAAVVHAIIALAHNLDMKLIAEGVETSEHVSMLQALDCDMAQGYFFGKPMTAAEAERRLRSRNIRPAA